MVIKSFEEIQAWQKARDLTNEIYRLTNKSLFAKDFGLRDQIRRASVSVMSNIAEGFERHSNAEFVQFLFISKASSAEVRSLLYVAQAQKYINNEEMQYAQQLASSCSQLTSKFITYLRNSKKNVRNFITLQRYN